MEQIYKISMHILNDFIKPIMRVNPKWLLKTSGRIERRFLKNHSIQENKIDDFREIIVDGKPYYFPYNTNPATCRLILAELLSPDHPHQYLTDRTNFGHSDVVLDIGACEGAFSAVAAERGARVIIIEPSRVNCAVIRKIFAEWNLPQPMIHQVLIGENGRDCHFHDDPSNPGASCVVDASQPGAYPVKMLCLDALWRKERWERVNFVKIDAEGFDLDILKSGKELLVSQRPKISVTAYHKSEHAEQIADFLRGMGYQTYFKGCLNTRKDGLRTVMVHAW